MQLIIALALWVLVGALAIGTRRRTDQSILYAAIMIAVSLTLNIDAVYFAADGLLGGRNYADLPANLLLLVGVYFLSRAILRASSPSRACATDRPFRGGAIVTACLMVMMFVFIDAPQTSGSFMQDFGNQPAAAAYSLIQFTYLGIVVALTGTICLRFAGRMSTPARRLGFRIIGAGCGAAVLTVLSVVGMDLAHVFGAMSLLALFASAYDVLNLAAFLLLCLGLSLPPILGWVTKRIDRRKLRGVLPDLTRIWNDVSAQHVELGDETHRHTPGMASRDVDTVVHRTLVEIRDALLFDPSVRDRLTDEDLALLTATETHIGAQSASA
ncbi:hypothetical protein E3T55_19635 [Cryobacterium frigoriphilum]|uniref:Histidine kinase N-terminal 7TM region domain-containing protein n=1 Tax=Cryobacterium frigoriphilum TaxID=1259150 RepID=A0A4R8ZTK7_9MICO|nr:hypothetical protein [Cryobacterium frigoriphilum]TFD45007.1 hypothetical protein E3T55_19635 [Cryobacterium frigoriphilum]